MQIFISSFAFCRSITIVSSRFMVTWRISGNDRLKHFATWNRHILKVGVFNVCFPDCPHQFFQTLDSTTSISSHGKHLWIVEMHGTDAICDPRLELLTTELCHPHQKITRHGFDEMRSALSRLCKNQKKCSPNFGVWHVFEWLMRIMLGWCECCFMIFDVTYSTLIPERYVQCKCNDILFSQPHRFKFTFKVMKTWSPTTFGDTGYIPIIFLSIICYLLKTVSKPDASEMLSEGPERSWSHKYGDFGSETTTKQIDFWVGKNHRQHFCPPTIETRIFEAQLYGNKIWRAF